MVVSKVQIWPNPTRGILHITAPDPIDQVKVNSLGGVLVLKAISDIVDIGNLASDMYLVQVNNYKAVHVLKK